MDLGSGGGRRTSPLVMSIPFPKTRTSTTRAGGTEWIRGRSLSLKCTTSLDRYEDQRLLIKLETGSAGLNCELLVNIRINSHP